MERYSPQNSLNLRRRTWTCNRCTLENNKTHLKCAACGYKKSGLDNSINFLKKASTRKQYNLGTLKEDETIPTCLTTFQEPKRSEKDHHQQQPKELNQENRNQNKLRMTMSKTSTPNVTTTSSSSSSTSSSSTSSSLTLSTSSLTKRNGSNGMIQLPGVFAYYSKQDYKSTEGHQLLINRKPRDEVDKFQSSFNRNHPIPLVQHTSTSTIIHSNLPVASILEKKGSEDSCEFQENGKKVAKENIDENQQCFKEKNIDENQQCFKEKTINENQLCFKEKTINENQLCFKEKNIDENQNGQLHVEDEVESISSPYYNDDDDVPSFNLLQHVIHPIDISQATPPNVFMDDSSPNDLTNSSSSHAVWDCKSCTYANPISYECCVMCNSAKLIQKSPSNNSIFENEEETSRGKARKRLRRGLSRRNTSLEEKTSTLPLSSFWQCGRCTFENQSPSFQDRCEMCDFSPGDGGCPSITTTLQQQEDNTSFISRVQKEDIQNDQEMMNPSNKHSRDEKYVLSSSTSLTSSSSRKKCKIDCNSMSKKSDDDVLLKTSSIKENPVKLLSHELWQCPNCGHDNLVDSLNCVICDSSNKKSDLFDIFMKKKKIQPEMKQQVIDISSQGVSEYEEGASATVETGRGRVSSIDDISESDESSNEEMLQQRLILLESRNVSLKKKLTYDPSYFPYFRSIEQLQEENRQTIDFKAMFGDRGKTTYHDRLRKRMEQMKQQQNQQQKENYSGRKTKSGGALNKKLPTWRKASSVVTNKTPLENRKLPAKRREKKATPFGKSKYFKKNGGLSFRPRVPTTSFNHYQDDYVPLGGVTVWEGQGTLQFDEFNDLST